MNPAVYKSDGLNKTREVIAQLTKPTELCSEKWLVCVERPGIIVSRTVTSEKEARSLIPTLIEYTEKHK